MVVGGTAEEPTLGILDADGRGVDLRELRPATPGLLAALPGARRLRHAGADLTPYDVPRRSGELKHLLVTESPDGELMLRFVLRSQEPVARDPQAPARRCWPRCRSCAVVSVNLQPEHKAVLEGDREILLTGAVTLRMRVNDLDLHLRPQSFFQTNTEIAAALYRQAARVGRRAGAGVGLGPLLRGRRLRAALRRARPGRHGHRDQPRGDRAAPG